jgi:uroporphyrinogen-III synthase
MLEHYNNWYAGVSTTDKQDNLPVLFLVGDQRRDIIPKTLMDPNLSSERRIGVREIVVYGTGVMEPFEQEFMNLLTETEEKEIRWVVVFSPTGCEAMLRALGMLDMETGRVKTGERGGGCGVRKGKRRTYIATIGPTTRDYLRKTFGFEPDVCAEKPSPEGISIGIQKFMDSLKDC